MEKPVTMLSRKASASTSLTSFNALKVPSVNVAVVPDNSIGAWTSCPSVLIVKATRRCSLVASDPAAVPRRLRSSRWVAKRIMVDYCTW